MNEENVVSKYFTAAFVLDTAKLNRLLNILENRFKEVGQPFQPEFKVTHNDGKTIKLRDVESLLALDNTIKNRITELEIEVPNRASLDDGVHSRYVSLEFEDAGRRNIHLSVMAKENARVANQIFAEVEEQIERTFTNDLFNKLKLSNSSSLFIQAITMMLMISFAIPALLFILQEPSPDPEAIANSQRFKELYDRAKQNNDMASKVDFLFAIESGGYDGPVTPRKSVFSFNIRQYLNLRVFFISLPIIIIIISLVYLIGWCYPRAVFMWGDMETRYKRIVARRIYIWSVVVLAVLIELVGNMFSFGLTNM